MRITHTAHQADSHYPVRIPHDAHQAGSHARSESPKVRKETELGLTSLPGLRPGKPAKLVFAGIPSSLPGCRSGQASVWLDISRLLCTSLWTHVGIHLQVPSWQKCCLGLCPGVWSLSLARLQELWAVPSGPVSMLLICSFLAVHVAGLGPGMEWPCWGGQVNLANGGVMRSKSWDGQGP